MYTKYFALDFRRTRHPSQLWGHPLPPRGGISLFGFVIYVRIGAWV